VLGHRVALAGQDNIVAASWGVAFDRLDTDHPPALLLSLAWLALEPIPVAVFTQHPDKLPDPLPSAISDPLVVAAGTGLLQRRGLPRSPGDTRTRSAWSHCRAAPRTTTPKSERRESPGGPLRTSNRRWPSLSCAPGDHDTAVTVLADSTALIPWSV
jgi:hypothetical protein